MLLSGPSVSFLAYFCSGFKRFCTLSYHFVYFGVGPIMRKSSKNRFFFVGGGAKLFFNLPVSSLFLENSLFWFCWNPIKQGFQLFDVCWCSKRRKEPPPKIDNWNFWIWVFLIQKWPSRDHFFFWFFGLLKPLLYSDLGGREYWAKLSRNGFFLEKTKTQTIWTDNWKAHFGGFLGFSCFFFLFFFEGLRVKWGGPKHLTCP